jgi:hypothetical protein
MSKGMNSKKQTRKEPAKSMLEKRAAKRAKKAARGTALKPSRSALSRRAPAAPIWCTCVRRREPFAFPMH